MIQASILTDHFLVATPQLGDANFAKSVVYIYEHNEDGALGMIVNKPMQISLGSVLDHLDIEVTKEKIAQHPVLMGGPVSQEHGFIIYDPDSSPPQASKDVLVSASKDMLKDIAVGKGPKNFLVTLGYAGWQSGQLEQEITRNDWLIVPFNRIILFNTPIEQRWRETATLIGVDINRLSDQIGHA